MTISRRHLLAGLAVAFVWQAPSLALVQDVNQTQSPALSLETVHGDGLAYPSAATSLTLPVPDQIPVEGFVVSQDDVPLFVLTDSPPQTIPAHDERPGFFHNGTAQQQFPLHVDQELGARSLVPLPGAVWLLFSALGLTGLLRGRSPSA